MATSVSVLRGIVYSSKRVIHVFKCADINMLIDDLIDRFIANVETIDIPHINEQLRKAAQNGELSYTWDLHHRYSYGGVLSVYREYCVPKHEYIGFYTLEAARYISSLFVEREFKVEIDPNRKTMTISW